MLESIFTSFTASNGLTIALYIDPTAGGVLLQVILGGATGIFVLVKLFWDRLTSFVLRRDRKRQETAEEQPPASE